MAKEDIDVEKVIASVESKIPTHLLSEIEMIIFGHFQEFEERSLNAFYDSGTLYISNLQDDEEDLYDDIVHEISHSLENPHGYEIYGDKNVQDEFLRKRKYMHDILWTQGFKAPLSFFLDTEYNKEFDMFLYKKIGYDTLSTLLEGIFVSPYAATSLREYFATGFTEYYLDSNHNFLKKVSPALYEKLFLLQDPEALDNL
jgi:Mlc titration factor MtfA (ptsG expression regulator)